MKFNEEDHDEVKFNDEHLKSAFKVNIENIFF
jgi:hypothetical protein